MKKLKILIILLNFCVVVFGQVIDDSNKNIIGYNRLQTGSGDWMDIQLIGAGSKFQLFDHSVGKYFMRVQSGNDYLEFPQNVFVNGKVGIGTQTPSQALDILGNIYLNSETATASKSKVNSSCLLFKSSGYAERTRYQLWQVLSVGKSIWGSGDLVFNSNTDGMGYNERIRFSSDGKVGIGTTTPSAKLDVNGNIKAHEIEVTLAAMQDLQLNGTLAANNITYTANGNTADFVFEDNYQLKDLSEVEAFIKANKHLPEIPSADEMEEAGVNLAEMNKLLLMKVEELTLYSIEQEKARKELEERLAKLEALLSQ